MDETAIEQEDGATVIRIAGALDLSSAPTIYQRLVESVTGGSRDLVLDVEAVDLVDWAGLGAVAGMLWRVRSAGGEIRLRGAGPQVRDALNVSRLGEIIEQIDDDRV